MVARRVQFSSPVAGHNRAPRRWQADGRPERPSHHPASDSDSYASSIPVKFAQEVARAMHGNVLRYSRRAALLKRAHRLGIGRFDANLIIAVVQNRCEAIAAETRTAPKLGNWTIVGIVLSVEAAALAAAWFFL